MLVGEQPGRKEDLAGKPFVGPAGQMLDRALEEAGIDRRTVYVTNAVKHFKFVPRGKIRLHQKPNTPEIKACRPWYERELAAIKPELVVAMGATAAQSVFGKITPINKNRGHLIDLDDEGTRALVTVHPSYLLRLPTPMPRHGNISASFKISRSPPTCCENQHMRLNPGNPTAAISVEI
jgi:DNA polymerase